MGGPKSLNRTEPNWEGSIRDGPRIFLCVGGALEKIGKILKRLEKNEQNLKKIDKTLSGGVPLNPSLGSMCI